MAGINLTQVYTLDGVSDLPPTKARAQFAMALFLEERAGKTTEQAEKHLKLAIEALKEDKEIEW